MPKTRFERLDTPGSGIAAFRISGKLGFHQNSKVEHLIDECLKRNFKIVVFDFSGLSSLGGGVAKIFRNFVSTLGGQGGVVRFVINSDTVLEFLRDDDVEINVFETYEEAMSKTDSLPVEETSDEAHVEQQVEEQFADADVVDQVSSQTSDIILMSYDGKNESDTPQTPGDGDNIISEIFDSKKDNSPPSWIEDPVSPFDEKRQENTGGKEETSDINKRLKRSILELKALFSISTDFNAIKDKKRLIDIFLLTSIAQGGVESAVFFEKKEELYVPVMLKGISEEDLVPFNLSDNEMKRISGNHDLISIDSDSFNENIRKILKASGLEYFYPFNTKDGMTGIVFLGKRITGRGMQKEDFEFMKILINIVRGAFQNAVMFEREHNRTLGIVKTLISLIEENTLLKGTSEFVSRYVGMVAKDMDYPEDHFNDLIYGTVLRDMGMIKVSDLIVRSPRELSKDEWNVINRHPDDGAEMLRRMKFNDHVINIVMSHHERFNGEGYPRGLRGKEIPLGARIISAVESYSAMIHERPNRPALSEKEALETLKENYGLRYDREIVKRFVKIMEKEIARSVRPVGVGS